MVTLAVRIRPAVGEAGCEGVDTMTRIIQTKKGNVRLLIIDQERLVDDLSLQELHRELKDCLSHCEEKQVVVDLARVAFMASAALGMFVRLRKRCVDRGITLKLCSPSVAIEQAFNTTGLNTLFEIHPDREAAIASFQ